MGAAWRIAQDQDLESRRHGQAVREARHGDLRDPRHADGEQACTLKDAGLDYYNHNIDSAAEFYKEIISTRAFQDRLDTLGTCAPPA